MTTQRFLTGTVAGAIVLFFAGWLIWGVLLADFMMAHSNQDILIDPPYWWALILSQVFWAALLTLAIKWTAASDWKAGAKTGATIGLLAGFAVDLGFYSMTTVADLTMTLVDPLAMAVNLGLAGAVVAHLGRSKD